MIILAFVGTWIAGFATAMAIVSRFKELGRW